MFKPFLLKAQFFTGSVFNLQKCTAPAPKRRRRRDRSSLLKLARRPRPNWNEEFTEKADPDEEPATHGQGKKRLTCHYLFCQTNLSLFILDHVNNLPPTSIGGGRDSLQGYNLRTAPE